VGIAPLKIIILPVVLLLLGGGGFFAWSKLSATDEDTGEPAAECEETHDEQQAPVETETLPLGEFLVNLHSSDGTLRYLQTEISIVVVADREESEDEGGHGGHGGGGEQEDNELPPASHRYARDVAIQVLSSQSFETLRDRPDRSRLKAMLQQKLDAALDGYQVRDVLFTAFVMQ
jgi:flagellar FliL protein